MRDATYHALCRMTAEDIAVAVGAMLGAVLSVAWLYAVIP